MVSKNGGIEKLIEQINKGGKGKASIYKYEDREFLQILSKEETNYYEIENNSNSTFKFINVGGVKCTVSTCPNGTICKLTFFGGRERCACDNGTSTEGSGCSDASIALAINDFIPQLDVSAFPISTDNNGHLTASSVKDLKNIILQAFPKATVTKSEIIKEGKDEFVVSSIIVGENKSLIINSINIQNNKKNVVFGNNMSVVMSCGGVCGSGECRAISPVLNIGGSITCPCGIPPRNCNPQFGNFAGWQTK